MSDFLTLYPGVYLPEEQDALNRVRTQIAEDLKRAELSFEELVKTSDGRSRGVPYRVEIKPEDVAAQMSVLDPYNPLWFDTDYAKNSSYGAKPAPEGWSCPKGGYFGGLNKSFGDITCVKEHHHYMTFHAPIYQGDILYPVLVDQGVWDATPYEGSDTRTWALRGTAKVYNQRGELVLTQTCGVKECFKIYADPAKRTWNAENAGVSEPEFANHQIHHYTDEDWETIQTLWAQEVRRGSQTLYWEDVNVGDQPPITVDGPYSAPAKGGMVMSVSTPSRSDWYVREHWGEAGLVRDAFGVYHNPELDFQEKQEKQAAMEAMMRANPHPRPPEPQGKGPGNPPKPPLAKSPVEIRGKATFDNFTGRDSALRAIHNWMGDDGRIVNLSWCIGAHTPGDRGISGHPNRQSPFAKVPGMEGRHAEIHGEEGDLSINRLYVTDKRVDEIGRHLVDLTWWCQTIEGQIHTEGTATVLLPSKACDR